MDFRKGKNREHPEINLIAFIDVLLVILIFLMVTTSYSKFTALKITLPSADAEKAVERPADINVAIDAQGRYSINNVMVSFQDVEGLAEDLKNAVNSSDPTRKDATVIVNADMAATHQSVVNVMEAARLAGLQKLTFSSQSSRKK